MQDIGGIRVTAVPSIPAEGEDRLPLSETGKRQGDYDTDSLIAFLKDLKRQMRGKKVILIWDGLPAHKPYHDRVRTKSVQVADGRASAGLRAGSQSGGEPVGQHQGTRTCQSVRERSRRGDAGVQEKHGTCSQVRPVVFFLSRQRQSFSCDCVSLYYARLSRTGCRKIFKGIHGS